MTGMFRLLKMMMIDLLFKSLSRQELRSLALYSCAYFWCAKGVKLERREECKEPDAILPEG